MPEMMAMMGNGGFAVVDQKKVHTYGTCPHDLAIPDIASWAAIRGGAATCSSPMSCPR